MYEELYEEKLKFMYIKRMPIILKNINDCMNKFNKNDNITVYNSYFYGTVSGNYFSITPRNHMQMK